LLFLEPFVTFCHQRKRQLMLLFSYRIHILTSSFTKSKNRLIVTSVTQLVS
jgi:hypothetical protein